MQPPDQFEFETPGLDRREVINISTFYFLKISGFFKVDRLPSVLLKKQTIGQPPPPFPMQ
jgi:hypothetical protein